MATQDTHTHPVDPPVTPQLAAMWALHQARKHRHHPLCRCMRFGGLYCNAADALWQNALNRELDKIAWT